MMRFRPSAARGGDQVNGIVKINIEESRFELETSAGSATAEYHLGEDVLIVF
jgi:hypothetical protein